MQCRECAEAGLEAAELLRGSGNVWDEVEVLGFATYGLVGAGRFGEAARLATYGEPVAERLGSVPALLQFHRTHGMVGDAESGDV